METFLIRALQLIMSLSLLIIIHEGGHFLFARLFKVRVEKFCLFFDPWFTLFKFKPKKSETEYAVGWLPLGGYVKIAGMIDESMDTEQMKRPEQPWEFRSKPAWQRLLIMVGGVLFNFLLALFIYSMILFAWGDQYVKVRETPFGMDFNETAKSVGFRDGDILLSADGVPFERYDGDMMNRIVDAREVSVLRGGEKVSVYIPEDMMQRLMTDSVRFASFRFPYVVDSVMANSPAALAGIQVGDSIIALDGKPVSFSDYSMAIAGRKKNEAALRNDSIDPRSITLTYVRAGETNTLTMQLDSTYKMGVIAGLSAERLLPVVKKEYGFFESFPAGMALGVKTLKGYVGNMKYLFSKEGAKQLGGFGTLGSIFPATWDWHQFWYMTAFLSIILAFMNILPIPALDGGHVLFLLYEMIARRKPSDKFMEYAQMTGMILLFGLLLWANFNDVLRFFF
ncbi:putative RIP metalloprotease RseP [Bacteroides pyogenes F0041]|uniref:Zinc metalloprotease n=1 Tax=Bacteroides pyogenes F0041 TaxID=1321819 RepID=U2CM05_9BACE|nr:RIP metalloprotease RseP [Bacteroides pyogenes]ERI85575.1 putative RIP metalloprotease RseP [Bacteroides pyogenes F0041]MBB3896365.1 regulator of sigma E protease [Bacteroides pyogenes]GAE23689.1 membrane-associated zinc metalloprotease [Bacteroides pyogenes JCM 10003]SUV31104.1 zinc metalloprotease [Bacteroides pyogenes]